MTHWIKPLCIRTIQNVVPASCLFSFNSPPECLTLGEFWTHPSGWRPLGSPRTRWRKYISSGLEASWSFPGGKKNGEGDIWTTWLIRMNLTNRWKCAGIHTALVFTLATYRAKNVLFVLYFKHIIWYICTKQGTYLQDDVAIATCELMRGKYAHSEIHNQSFCVFLATILASGSKLHTKACQYI